MLRARIGRLRELTRLNEDGAMHFGLTQNAQSELDRIEAPSARKLEQLSERQQRVDGGEPELFAGFQHGGPKSKMRNSRVGKSGRRPTG